MKRFLTFAVLLLAVQLTFATVHHVPGTYSTILAALNACSAGDTVLVAPGTYYENIVWPSTQNILLKSESGANATIIDGGGIAKVISINTSVYSTTIIDGFTIKNGYAPNGGGIGCGYSSSPTIKNNIITQNVAYDIPTNYGGGGGIAVGYNSSPIIIDNIIEYNSATAGFGGGLACAINCNPIIENNIFENNSSESGGGAIFIHTGCSATITNNIVRYNTSQRYGGGMAFWETTSIVKFNTIENNTAEETGGGIEFGGADMSLFDSDTIRYNTAHTNGGGIGMHGGAMPTLLNNEIIYNEADSSGGGIACNYESFPTIQNNSIGFNTAGYPGGAGISISYGSSPFIIDNEIMNCSTATGGGGGILVYENSNPIIDHNTISNNYSIGGGGGLLVYIGCSPYIVNNTITDNTADNSGGGLCLRTSTSVVKFNLVKNNTNAIQGAGIFSGWTDQSVVDSNDILENYGDGIFCKEGSTPLINWNNICGNTSYGVRNIDPSVTVNAEHNWWDHVSGPGGAGPGTGDEVSTYVDYDPWLSFPVPVELTSFTATCIAGEVILNWTTATEINNLGFEIERRIIIGEEQGEWILIGFREGHGTTTEPKEYSYIDNINGIKATSFAYRLKQIDFNGTYEYSDEIFVANLAPADFVLEQNYPNPFNPTTTISYGVPVKSHIALKVFNAQGKEVATLVNEEKPIGAYELTWNSANLPSGIYFYQLKAGNFIETKKMILLK